MSITVFVLELGRIKSSREHYYKQIQIKICRAKIVVITLKTDRHMWCGGKASDSVI